MQRLVQGTGARVEPTARLRGDVFPDRVPVRTSFAQGDQDVKCQISQRSAMWSVIVRHTCLTAGPLEGLPATIVLGTTVQVFFVLLAIPLEQSGGDSYSGRGCRVPCRLPTRRLPADCD